MIYFIVNPVAGNGGGKKTISVIENFMNEKKLFYKILITEEQGHATILAKEAIINNASRIIAVGGDGTILEVADGMVYQNIPLGIIPIGTGNDLCKTLNIKKDLRKALETVIDNNTIYSDMISINGRYFLNVGSVGIDAEIAGYSSRIKKRSGKASYFVSVLKNIITYKPIKATISIDGKIIEGKFTLLAIANGKYYGNGFKIAPTAQINSGVINVCVIKKLTKLQILLFFPSVIFGLHTRIKKVQMYDAKEVVINYEEKYVLNLDGNLYSWKLPLKFKIHHNALRILV